MGRASAMRRAAGEVARSPRVRAAASFPFRLGPADSDWRARPFAGLAVVNNLSGAGDALVTVALAGSVFVSVSLHAARGRTALGLVCTVLPFAVVGPFVGPAIDRLRGGRRFIVFLAAIARVAACLMMAAWIHSLLLFPAAFTSLVASKTHAVAKASLVPGVVDRADDLVRANSRLAVGGAVYTSLAAGLAGIVYKLFGSRAILDLDVLVFAACAGLSLYLLRNTRDPAGVAPEADPASRDAAPRGPATATAFVEPPPPPPGAPAPAEAPGAHLAAPAPGDGARGGPGHAAAAPVADRPGYAAAAPLADGPARAAPPPPPFPGRVRRPPPGPLGRALYRIRGGARPYIPRSLSLASVAMAGMRATAGFLTALVVFAFRRDGAPLIWYGLVGAASVGGNFGGALLAPRARARVNERRLVGGAALLIGGTAIAVCFLSGAHRRPAAVVLALVVALGASLAKTAFDAIVQTDTRDAERSRLFARFESMFQLAWVAGALVPTLIATPLLVGFLLVAVTVLGTSAVFVTGLARDGGGPPPGGAVPRPPVPMSSS